MEKFTNNRDEYLQQIKKELLEYDVNENWREIFTYVEMPFFLRYAFSYNWSMNTQTLNYRLMRKEWNAEYDHARFDKGIYNLDRLAIVEKEVQVKMEDEKYFMSIDWSNIDTVEFKGIVLDGLICELKVRGNATRLNWNINAEMNEELSKLVSVMRNWQREMKEL